MIAASIDLGDGLSHIATALRVPVLIAAVVILVLCALECGRFAVEWWRRRRNRRFDLRQVVAGRSPTFPRRPLRRYARSPIAARAVLAIAAAPPPIAPRRPSVPWSNTSSPYSAASTAPACWSAPARRSG